MARLRNTHSVGSSATEEGPSLSEHDSQTAPPSAGATRRATILVVAHEPSVLSVTTRILERRHFRTLEARSPREALGLFRTHPGEIRGVVLDLGLPGGAAEALAGELRGHPGTLPILFTGSFSEDSSSIWVSPDPADGFLPKPFGLDALGAKADLLFGGQPAASSGQASAGSGRSRSV